MRVNIVPMYLYSDELGMCLSSAIMALGLLCLGAELSRHHGTVQLSIDQSPLILAVCSVNRMYVHHQFFARPTLGFFVFEEQS